MLPYGRFAEHACLDRRLQGDGISQVPLIAARRRYDGDLRAMMRVLCFLLLGSAGLYRVGRFLEYLST